jgi:hypothetical protein
VAYLILCAKLGYRLPGTKTIPEHIAAQKKPYYEALEAADRGSMAELESYLSDLLARQLVDVYETATGQSR